MNIFWPCFLVVSCMFSLGSALLSGKPDVLIALMEALFDSAKLSIDLLIGLVGVLCFWLGFFRIIEKTGLVAILARGLSPIFSFLMPSVPKGHAAFEPILLNVSANFLGLDNAATPMGLKAMQLLQTLNPHPKTLTDPQILFLVLNTASITFFPMTVFMYRAQMGAEVPTDVFLPLLLTSFCATFSAVLLVICIQKFKERSLKNVGMLLMAVAVFVALLVLMQSLQVMWWVEKGVWVAPAFLVCFLGGILMWALYKKINCLDVWVEGAKEGFQLALQMAPYLVAMLVAVGLFRASGLLDAMVGGIAWCLSELGMKTDFVGALPSAIMKTFSGSAARAMMIDVLQHDGADSFVGHLVSMVQGSSETTVYVLTLYTGVIGIQKIRYALYCSLFADVAAFGFAVFFARLFF